MSLNLNQYTVAGMLTRDPEVKHTPKGTAVCQFGMAVNRVWKDDSGTKHEEVLFLDIEAWGGTATVIGDYCRKGHCILLEARLKLDQWDDKQTGQKRSKIKVIAEKMHFVSVPKAEQEAVNQQRSKASGKSAVNSGTVDQEPEDDDQLPYD